VGVAAHLRTAIAVLTYQRPEALTELLAALEELVVPPPGDRLAVYVVDNDPGRSAVDIVRLAATGSRHDLVYVWEPRPGIARARNAALDTVEGAGHEAVAFLDDDEIPDPHWLVRLVSVAEESGAAGVAGPVLTEFEREPGRGLSRSGVFARQRHPTGERLRAAATNNLLLRLAAVRRLDPPSFDVERFNLTGGEDTDLTSRLTGAGHLLVWADDAVVREVVPASRVTWGWALRRAHRTGNTAGRVMIGRDESVARRLACLGGGLARLLAGTSLVLIRTLPGVSGHPADAIRIAARGAGYISAAAGRRHEEYRRANRTIPGN
jgi:GT2 family glycosyltransferase